MRGRKSDIDLTDLSEVIQVSLESFGVPKTADEPQRGLTSVQLELDIVSCCDFLKAATI